MLAAINSSVQSAQDSAVVLGTWFWHTKVIVTCMC
jgi:hypothetical protein